MEHAVEGGLQTEPDVVFLDVHLPDGSGVSVVERCPGMRFLALNVSDAAEDVIGVIRAGARGYVTEWIPRRARRRDPLSGLEIELGTVGDLDPHLTRGSGSARARWYLDRGAS